MITNEISAQKKSLGDELYAHNSNELLLKAYALGPERIRKAISGLTEDEMKARPIPGKWSIAEIVIHLADGEIVASCRIRQAYCEHPDPFPYYIEAEWAEKLKYQKRDLLNLADYLSMFELLRRTTAPILYSCTEKDWIKEGIHPQRGKMNLRGLLELYADHSERHIVQILERRTLLGKHLDMEIILPDRLY